MNLTQILERMRHDKAFSANITHWHVIEAKAARYAPFPEGVDPRLLEVLGRKGIHQLYTHQAQAVDAIMARLHEDHLL